MTDTSKTILVIEDNRHMRRLLKRKIERETGFSVVEAENHEIAINMLSDELFIPDVIVSDFNTKCAVNGEAFLSGNHHKEIPTIGISSKRESNEAMRASGAVAIFDKQDTDTVAFIKAIVSAATGQDIQVNGGRAL